MFERVALAALDHLLATTPWARERLRPFAGRTGLVEAAPFLSLRLGVTDDGSLTPDSAGSGDADVTIRLPDDAPLLWLTDRPAVFGSARIAGAADFAEALAFVFRNLRWDAEADLAAVVGDIAAHRLAATGRRIADWHQRALRNIGANVGEFLLDDGAVARREEIQGFGAEVDRLRDDLERLARRVDVLRRP